MGCLDTDDGPLVLSIALHTFQLLGVPVASHKTKGPASRITFLGVLIDTEQFTLKLPPGKVSRIKALVQSWLVKRACTRRELESLLGHLSHAAMVIRAGRPFLRQLFSLLAVVHLPDHYVRLNLGARADLAWWHCFLCDWNGSSFFPLSAPSHHVYSDASGLFGCGALMFPSSWFQLQWSRDWIPVGIVAKELLPIVIAAAIWGHSWDGLHICFHSDNMAVVDILRKRSSKDPLIMHLLRCFCFFSAYFKFSYSSEHVPGVENVAADAISRNNLQLLFSFFPQVPPSSVPRPVLELLVNQRPDWGSETWTEMFYHSLLMVSHQPLRPCTALANAAS